MNILFLTTILPRHQRMGSEVASQCFITALRQAGHQVTVVGYMRRDDAFMPDETEVVVGQRYIETNRAKGYPLLWMLLSFLFNLPYSSAKYYARAYRRRVKALLAQQPDAMVIFDHPQLGWLRDLISPIHPQIMIAHNIEHDIYRQHAQSSRQPLAAWIYRREARLIQSWEDQLAIATDQVWALTDQDAKYFAQIGGTVRTVSLPASFTDATDATTPAAGPTAPPPKICDIGLIGSWAWKPNQEGLHWFLQNVYPLLPTDLSIQIAGRGADWLNDPDQAKLYPNLRYCGFVPNAQVFMAQARVVAIATLSGGGIQIKTLDAIASGSQIVATSIALRGIGELPATVQIADQPSSFAAALLSAICQPQSGLNDSGRSWQQQRQTRFLSEISQAVDDLFRTKQLTKIN
ncbi:MAG: glycosyltransferase [Elainella sp.]